MRLQARWVRFLCLVLIASPAVAQPPQVQPPDPRMPPPAGAPLPPPGDDLLLGEFLDQDAPMPPAGPPHPGMPDLRLFRGMNRRNFPQRFVQADQMLEACRAQFEQAERERQGLIDRVAALKREYAPGEMTPGNVIKRKELEEALSRLHEFTRHDRENTFTAARLLRVTIRLRSMWEPLVAGLPAAGNREAEPSAPSPQLPEALRARWLRALEALERKDHAAYANALLGESFGPVAYESMSSLPRRPGGDSPEFGDDSANQPPQFRGRGDAPLQPETRGKLLGRLERLERRQEEMLRQIERQQRDIDNLRRILEAPPERETKDPSRGGGGPSAAAPAPPATGPEATVPPSD